MGAGTEPAAPGTIWVCGACGKTSKTQYGFDGDNKPVADRGWDMSCAMSAVLCSEVKNADGLYVPVEPVKGRICKLKFSP